MAVYLLYIEGHPEPVQAEFASTSPDASLDEISKLISRWSGQEAVSFIELRQSRSDGTYRYFFVRADKIISVWGDETTVLF